MFTMVYTYVNSHQAVTLQTVIAFFKKTVKITVYSDSIKGELGYCMHTHNIHVI